MERVKKMKTLKTGYTLKEIFDILDYEVESFTVMMKDDDYDNDNYNTDIKTIERAKEILGKIKNTKDYYMDYETGYLRPKGGPRGQQKENLDIIRDGCIDLSIL